MADLRLAMKVAEEAHHGQVDKQGLPVILHVMRVVDRVRNPTAKEVAALHDVLEDTNVRASELAAMGFSAEVIDAVVAITRGVGETYAEYVRRLSKNPLATEVKLADLRDNMHRLSMGSDPTGSLRNRYTAALAYLRGDEDVTPRE